MMFTFPIYAALASAAGFLASLLLTPLVRGMAIRGGAVAAPKSDRWHTRPTAMLGGVAIAAATLTALLLLPHTREIVIVAIASAALFLVGLADDFLHMKPYQKMIGQLLGAAAVIYSGLILPWTASYMANLLITLFWIVGITNAVNMLDNMDGLAAGASAIAALFLALNFYINGQFPQALMLIAFAGALLGFLVYNHHPASIFMGDCGSMFVGFFLACSALAAGPGGGRSRSIVAVLAVPVLVLVVPIFDTTLVTLMRKLAGRPASQGGRDHTSHRLVALGLSEKHAVWMLYTFAISGGAVAMLVRHVALDVSVGAIVAFSVMLTLLGVQLAHVQVYDDAEVTPPPGVFGFLLNLSYKRRLFEVALDVVLIVLSYYFANALVFGPAAVSSDWDLFLRTLSLALALKLAALLLSGVYRGLWRYATLWDVAVYARGVLLGSAATIVYAGIVGGFRRLTLAVFVIDAMLLLLAITASRFGFSVLRRLVPLHQPSGNRVVIYGAGDGGELLFRELLHRRELQRVPVAFLDDDARKDGRVLHGLTIATPNGPGSVAALCRAFAAEELLVSTDKMPVARLHDVIDECERAGIVVRRMTIDIRPLTRESLARA